MHATIAGYSVVVLNISRGTSPTDFLEATQSTIKEIKNICVRIATDNINGDPRLKINLNSLMVAIDNFDEYIKSEKYIRRRFSRKSKQLLEHERVIGSAFTTFFNSVNLTSHPNTFNQALLLQEAIHIVLESIENYRWSIDEKLQAADKPQPAPSIPTEIPAPIRVAVSEDRISLTAPKHKSGQLADKSIDNLRRSACDILDELIEELSLPTSNADRRLNPRIKNLRRELGVPLPDIAIEAVGLQWQVTSDVIAATHETVPDALLPQIQRILSTIRTLLSQFDEWHEYEAVTIAETIKPEDTHDLAQIGDEIATDIAAKTEIIDNQIGDRLHDMAVALSNGLVKRETIANPVIGSLSNLFAGIAQFVLERGSFIINPAVDVFMAVTDPTTLGRGIALLGFCTFIMNKFAPRLMEYAPFSWLKTILPTSLKYYSALSKSGKG